MNLPISGVVGNVLKRGTDSFLNRLKISSIEWNDAYDANIDSAHRGEADVLQVIVRNESDILIENVGGYLELAGYAKDIKKHHNHDEAELHRIEKSLPFAETGKLKEDFSPNDKRTLNVLVIKQSGSYKTDKNNYPIDKRFRVTVPQRGLDDLGDSLDDKFVRKMYSNGMEITPARPGLGPTVDELYNMDFDISSITVTGGRVSGDEENINIKELLSVYQER